MYIFISLHSTVQIFIALQFSVLERSPQEEHFDNVFFPKIAISLYDSNNLC